ncbi:MAG TPA: FKBP-type peptidyl-prolyl cis-trans isomerase [Allosphingosinicella sp.]|jgi:FKBP-type peptidyl-prolyl cis-trans isomerase
MTKLLAAAAASAIALASPSVAAQDRAAPAPVARDADYHNRQHAFLYALSPTEGWRTTASGLRYRRTGGAATGPSPSPTDTVTIHYVGRFIDGTEFDSSVARGEPATFPLPRLIRGWQEGVPLMRVGERFEFAIPAALAYGYAGRGPIPGGATLLFIIELIAIPPARAAPG